MYDADIGDVKDFQLKIELKSLSKVCADESTVAISRTCNECFSSGFFRNESQIIILKKHYWEKGTKIVENEEVNEEQQEGKKMKR